MATIKPHSDKVGRKSRFPTKELAQCLEDLSRIVIETAEQVSQSALGAQTELYFVHEPTTSLTYDERGIPQQPKFQSKWITKRAFHPVWSKVVQLAQDSCEYTRAFDVCKRVSRDPEITESEFDYYLGTVANKALKSKHGMRERNIKKVEDALINGLKGVTPTLKASVQLVGVSLPDNPIAFEAGPLTVQLRRPKMQDLRKELSCSEAPMRAISGIVGPWYIYPSAIATVSLCSKQEIDLQDAVDQAIATLRLFGIGSVGYIRCEMSTSGSYSPLAIGTSSPGSVFRGPEHLVITTSLIKPLKLFWKAIAPSVKSHLGFTRARHPLSPERIAYDYYTDALRRDTCAERRIANAVMGLEALLLQEGSGELCFRYSLLLAKLLSFSGLVPKNVRAIAKEAYGVRSVFAHGGRINSKQRKKIESQYGSLGEFTSIILDYLRRIIVIFLLTEPSKKEFLALTEDALIDPSRDADLRKCLEPFLKCGCFSLTTNP